MIKQLHLWQSCGGLRCPAVFRPTHRV